MVNIVAVGCGMVGKMIPTYLRGLGDNEKIVAYLGKTAEEAQGLKDPLKLGDDVFLGSYADDYDALLRGERGVNGEVVYVGTINRLHEDAVVKAANAGKDIFSEKPLSTSRASVFRMQDAIVRNGVLFEVDSAYGNHELSMQVRDELNPPEDEKRKRIFYAEGIYDQDWQKNKSVFPGWRAIIKEAGEGKLIKDLGFHWAFTLMGATGAVIQKMDGKAWNVHPNRYQLNENRTRKFLAEKLGKSPNEIDLSAPDTFGASDLPSYLEHPDLYDEKQMLGSMPGGKGLDQIVDGYDPRLFTGPHSGDDIAEANVIFAKDGYTFPGFARLSQVLKGKNEFRWLIVTEDGSYEFHQKYPEEMKVERDGKLITEFRGSDPGMVTGPTDHTSGYRVAVGLKWLPFVEKVEKRRAGKLNAEEVAAWNRDVLTRAVRTECVLDHWLRLQPGWQTIDYEGVWGA